MRSTQQTSSFATPVFRSFRRSPYIPSIAPVTDTSLQVVQAPPNAAVEGLWQARCQTSIILPAYNEAEALPSVLASLFAVVDDSYEVVVVDDGSTDATAQIARQFPCVLIQQANQGKGVAVRTGIRAAQGERIIIMDADNTYPAVAIPPMSALLEGHDLVRGNRAANKANMPLINRCGNKLFDWSLRVFHGLEGGDYLTGLYGLRREALAAIDFTADGFDMEVEIGIKARAYGLRTATLPIEYHERLGEKKLDAWQDGWRILKRVLSMALLYNPGLTFVLPGVLLWSLASILTFVMSRGALVSPNASLDGNGLMVGALAMSAGFQLIVFGITAALYGLQHGVPQKPWLRALSSASVRRGATLVGGVCTLFGVGVAISMMGRWALAGGSFAHVQGLVFAAVLLSLGMEIVLAAMFLSIFADRIEKQVPVQQTVRAWRMPEMQYSER